MAATGLLLLVDLDGVLYRGAEPVPGVAAVLLARSKAGDDVVYVTNNSMWYREEYVDRIAGMGAPVSADRIVSSPRATALYLRDHEPSIHHVLTVGASGLDRELDDAGFRVTRAGDAGERIRGGGVEGTDGGNGWEAAGRPEAIVVGLDPHIDYLRLTVATDCVRAGARFVATNRDPVYPTERAVRPGAGSIVAAIEAATGVRAISIGKPEPYLLEEAARAVGRDAADAVMIGDNLATDIAAAAAVGGRSVLMLTGVTGRAELDRAPSDLRPTAVAADAAELAQALDHLGTERRGR
jgi:phosphoglycolate/pyridoxal phosphate phosphatase family enzyme